MPILPEPLRIADYRAYWLARLLANMAQIGLVVVIGWQVYDTARNLGMSPSRAALQLGIVGLVQFVPLFALTLVAGWTADRFDRRWIGRASLMLELACALALAWLALVGATSLAALFLVAGLLGVARAFASPALGALAAGLVPRAILPHAIALSSIAWQAGAILGPALGGYLYAYAPPAPYVGCAILLAISFLCLMLIGPPARAEREQGTNPWRQMVDGLRYVRTNRFVLGAISLDLFAVLLGGATAMLPVFARDILHSGPAGLGHLRAAPAVGATLIAAWFAFRPLKHNVGVKMLLAVAAFGVATIVFGLSRSMALSLACLAVLGAADMVSVYVRQSLVQLYTPDAMRGRVGSASALFISASNELGEAESGFLAALIGPVAAVVAGGFGAVAIVGLWWRWFPELAQARSFDQPAPARREDQEARR